jgi:hypothetical protein
MSMAYESNLDTRSVVMAADYSAKQYMAIALDGTGKGAVPAAGADAYGVVQTKPIVGQVGTVAVGGVSKMVAGAAVAAGADVAVDAQGRAIAATTGAYAIGKATLAASGAGVIISVDLDIRSGKV